VSDPKLEEIKARHLAASRGPWVGIYDSGAFTRQINGIMAMRPILSGALACSPEDFTAILYSWEDIAWLLTRVEELEEEIESACVPDFRYEGKEPSDG
jgi:hypothetical protein